MNGVGVLAAGGAERLLQLGVVLAHPAVPVRVADVLLGADEQQRAQVQGGVAVERGLEVDEPAARDRAVLQGGKTVRKGPSLPSLPHATLPTPRRTLY